MCGKYGEGGRFAQKGGGQQVGSAFGWSQDNEKIKVVYGDYCFWSWLRYWYIDSADFVTLMLIDKSYYDYDYSESYKEEQERLIRLHQLRPKSNSELQSKLSKMGFGNIMAVESDEQIDADQRSLTEQEMRNAALGHMRG